MVIWAPTLIWEAKYHWPTFEMSRNLHQEHSGIAVSITFLPIQLLLPGWWAAPVWMSGLWALWREPRFHLYRSFAIAYALLFVLIGVYIGDRPYYFAGLYAVALAAGRDRRRRRRSRGAQVLLAAATPETLVWRSPSTVIAIILIVAAIDLPLSLPILPASALATVPLQCSTTTWARPSDGHRWLRRSRTSIDRCRLPNALRRPSSPTTMAKQAPSIATAAPSGFPRCTAGTTTTGGGGRRSRRRHDDRRRPREAHLRQLFRQGHARRAIPQFRRCRQRRGGHVHLAVPRPEETVAHDLGAVPPLRMRASSQLLSWSRSHGMRGSVKQRLSWART